MALCPTMQSRFMTPSRGAHRPAVDSRADMHAAPLGLAGLDHDTVGRSHSLESEARHPLGVVLRVLLSTQAPHQHVRVALRRGRGAKVEEQVVCGVSRDRLSAERSLTGECTGMSMTVQPPPELRSSHRAPIVSTLNRLYFSVRASRAVYRRSSISITSVGESAALMSVKPANEKHGQEGTRFLRPSQGSERCGIYIIHIDASSSATPSASREEGTRVGRGRAPTMSLKKIVTMSNACGSTRSPARSCCATCRGKTRCRSASCSARRAAAADAFRASRSSKANAPVPDVVWGRDELLLETVLPPSRPMPSRCSKSQEI